MVIVPAGLVNVLRAWLASPGAVPTLFLSLYTNDVTPSKASVVTDFVGALTDNGETGKFLNAWGQPYVNGANLAECDHATLKFQSRGLFDSTQAYGYYATYTGQGLQMAERFVGAPLAIPGGLSALELSLAVVADSLNLGLISAISHARVVESLDSVGLASATILPSRRYWTRTGFRESGRP